MSKFYANYIENNRIQKNQFILLFKSSKIKPNNEEIGTFNMISKQNIDTMYETGYRYGMEVIPEIINSLNHVSA